MNTTRKSMLAMTVFVCLAACTSRRVEEELGQVSAALATVQAAIPEQAEELVDLQQRISDAESRMAELESDNETLHEAIEQGEGRMDQLSDADLANSSKIRNNSTILGSLDAETENISRMLVALEEMLANIPTQQNQLLPESLDEIARSDLAATFQGLWNEEDWTGLCDQLSPLAQLELDCDKIVEAFPGFRAVCGELSEVEYSHYEQLGEENGADFYSLIYVASFETGLGDMTLHIRSIQSQWEIVGFYYNCRLT